MSAIIMPSVTKNLMKALDTILSMFQVLFPQLYINGLLKQHFTLDPAGGARSMLLKGKKPPNQKNHCLKNAFQFPKYSGSTFLWCPLIALS